MSQIDHLDRDLAAWFADTAQPRTPHYVDTILSATKGARQRPRWSFPDLWLPAAVARTVGVVPWRQIGLIVLAALLLVAAIALYAGSQRGRLPAPYGLARNGLVAYGEAGDIYTVDPVTPERRSIVTGPANDHDPRFSLDGTRLAFLREVDGGQLLVVTDVDGRNPVISAVDPLVEADSDSISWSPSGHAVAITAIRSDGRHDIELPHSLYVMDTTDGTVITIDSGYDEGEANWRPPDGRELMFVGGRYPDQSLILYALDTDEVTEFEVADGERGSLRPTGWMLDGRRFAYEIQHPQLGVNATHVLDLETLNEVTLRVARGRISNSGDRIVGFDGKGDDYQLCVVYLPDGPCAPIGGPNDGPDPYNRAGLQWSPDDQYILVRKEDRPMRAYDPEGRVIAQPSWLRYGGESIQRLAP
jgi:dipeptidyl aminopeptidase/acylaminoacyl peptidase